MFLIIDLKRPVFRDYGLHSSGSGEYVSSIELGVSVGIARAEAMKKQKTKLAFDSFSKDLVGNATGTDCLNKLANGFGCAASFDGNSIAHVHAVRKERAGEESVTKARERSTPGQSGFVKVHGLRQCPRPTYAV